MVRFCQECGTQLIKTKETFKRFCTRTGDKVVRVDYTCPKYRWLSLREHSTDYDYEYKEKATQEGG